MPRQAGKMSPRRRRLRLAGRKALRTLAVVALLGLLVLADRLGAFGRAEDADREKYHGKTFRVTAVIDGDTLDIDSPDRECPQTRIRLWGVDTPETVHPDMPPQHFGPEASRFTRGLAHGRQVRIELEPSRGSRDRHGRLLAYVFLDDDRMLNGLLVEGGYAYADPRYPHVRSAEFARLERQARQASRGLWKDATQADVPYYLQETVHIPATAP